MRSQNPLGQASVLISAGNKQEAAALLQKLIADHPADARPWALLSQALDDPDRRRHCLEQVIRLSANDEKATAWARRQIAALQPSPPAQVEPDVSSPLGEPPSGETPPLARVEPPPQRVISPIVIGALVLVILLMAGALALFGFTQPGGLFVAARGTPPTEPAGPKRPATYTPFPTSTGTVTPTPTATATPTSSPTPLPTVTPTYTASEALIAEGNTLLRRRQSAAALAKYDEALALDPNLIMAHVGKARAYIQQKQWAQAQMETNAALRIDPKHPAANLLIGDALYARREFESALAKYTEAIRLNPDDADSFVHRGNTYYRLYEPDLAYGDYERALSLAPLNPDALEGKANILSYYGCDNASDVQLYEQVIQIEPNDPGFYAGLGLCYVELEDLIRAQSYFDQALAIYSDEDVAIYGEGSILLRQNRLQAALDKFNRALELGHDSQALHVERGLANLLLGNNQDGLADYTFAIKIQPSNPCLRNNRCILYSRLQQFPQAVADCSLSIQLGGPLESYFNRAVAYDESHQVAKALADYKFFVDNVPQSPQTKYARERISALEGTPTPAPLVCAQPSGGFCPQVSALLDPASAIPSVYCPLH